MAEAQGADGVIRDATAADLGWLALSEREIFGPAAWSASLLEQDFTYGMKRYRVVEFAGEPVAYAIYGFDGDAFHLMNLAVREHARGRRLARLLMEDFMAEAVSVGATEVWLEVAVINAPAIALYRSYGFTDVRVRARYYQPGNLDALVMRAPVDGPGLRRG